MSSRPLPPIPPGAVLLKDPARPQQQMRVLPPQFHSAPLYGAYEQMQEAVNEQTGERALQPIVYTMDIRLLAAMHVLPQLVQINAMQLPEQQESPEAVCNAAMKFGYDLVAAWSRLGAAEAQQRQTQAKAEAARKN